MFIFYMLGDPQTYVNSSYVGEPPITYVGDPTPYKKRKGSGTRRVGIRRFQESEKENDLS
jgi:hypothetical protein